MARRIITWIVDGICVVLILASLCLLLTVVTTKSGEAPVCFGFTSFRVLTGSMEPALPVDSMVIVKQCEPGDIREGDIISFYTEDPEIAGSVVTHRAVQVSEVTGTVYIITKGDANPMEDAYPVMGANLIGKVVASSTLFGKIIGLTGNPIVFVLFILIPMLGILVANIAQTVKTVKLLEKEEMEKAEKENE